MRYCGLTQQETATMTNEKHHAVAKHFAEGIAHNWIEPDDLAQLQSDRGLVVGGVVVWHRTSDNRVVGWLGNELDFNMDRLFEVPVPRHETLRALADRLVRVGLNATDHETAEWIAGKIGQDWQTVKDEALDRLDAARETAQ